MKKLLLSASAIVAAAALSASAFAADLAARPSAKDPAYTAPAPVYNWTGSFIGGHVGGIFGSSDSISGNGGRFMGGFQYGADFQFASNWVVGLEGQSSWMKSTNTGRQFPSGTQVTANNDLLGSVTGRVGYAWGPTLLYAKGGYAWKDSRDINVTTGLGTPAASTTSGNAKGGYTVGAGLEYMFAPNWSTRVEYQYYKFGNMTVSSLEIPTGTATYNNDEHQVRAGINYRFNLGPKAGRY